MSKSAVAFGALFFLAVFIISSPQARAQGCGQTVLHSVPVECCGDPDDMRPDNFCMPGGLWSDYCYTGSGECCDQQYNSATILPNSCSCPATQDEIDACNHSCSPAGCGWWDAGCCCCHPPPPSPVVVDVGGEGFHFTSAENGVTFDITGNGHPGRMGWTALGSRNAFLALDRNNDREITSGKDLFGNFTPQPDSPNPNGFSALAEFDKPQNGGNCDGIIDHRDKVFGSLLLWIDENHDGIAQPRELYSLPSLGVFSVSLHYVSSKRQDQFGNQLRYKAALNPSPIDGRSPDGRWAYDVFFVVETTTANSSFGLTRSLAVPSKNCGVRRDIELLLQDRMEPFSEDSLTPGPAPSKSGRRENVGGLQ